MVNNQDPILTTPLKIKIYYALGQMGWSLAAFGITQGPLFYFYFPPETGEATSDFPSFIYQGAILGILTIFGLIAGFGRLFDAITDPYIATLSDRSTSSFGRRRKFMAIAFIPFALFSVLAFYPPISHESYWNVLWLTTVLVFFYLSLTLYVTPYTALISELGHTPQERLTISTFISVTYALGFVIGYQVFSLHSYFKQTMDTVSAFQTAILMIAILAAILMLIPIVLVDERKYCRPTVSKLGTIESVRAVFSNHNFRMFALSDLAYWIAFVFISTGNVYYLTVLLKLDASIAALFLPVLVLISFGLYPLINQWTNKWGKKRLMSAAFLVFCMAFGMVMFLGKIPVPPYIQLGFLMLVILLPLAIFSILPNAIVADLAHIDSEKTGNNKAAMYFGVRAMVMKMGIFIASLFFSSVLLLGKSVENDLGVRMTGLVAMVFCLIGYYFFTKYEDELHNAKEEA